MATNLADASGFATTLASSPLFAVHFWAGWAKQCEQIDTVLAELAKLNPNVKLLRVEAENFVDVCQGNNIVAVPSVLLFKNGKLEDRVDGANVPVLSKLFAKLAAAAPAAASAVVTPASSTPKDLNVRLKELVNAAPVMLFMKGTPDEPRCGFSRKIVGLLNEQEVKFSSFDILADSDVREGLKKYSDWPTFPQMYIAGDLIGGLDIVKEMAESGDLKSALPSEDDLPKRLEKIINREPVMVFIKGTPEAPRCGFSRTIVGILNEVEGCKYGYYDILGDDEVRQGLKKYSDWPTYPQLYVKGELQGGLDIVKEMKENGDLVSSLTGL